MRGERRRLLPAALTLLRAYQVAGCPDQALPGWGSYESWSDVVRATVVWLGLPDPADTREELEESSDTDRGVLVDLVAGLADLLGDLGGSATCQDMLRQLDSEANSIHYAQLRTALRELFPRLQGTLPTATQLAMKLRTYRGRIVGGTAIDQGERTYRGVQWTVRKLKKNNRGRPAAQRKGDPS